MAHGLACAWLDDRDASCLPLPLPTARRTRRDFNRDAYNLVPSIRRLLTDTPLRDAFRRRAQHDVNVAKYKKNPWSVLNIKLPPGTCSATDAEALLNLNVALDGLTLKKLAGSAQEGLQPITENAEGLRANKTFAAFKKTAELVASLGAECKGVGWFVGNKDKQEFIGQRGDECSTIIVFPLADDPSGHCTAGAEFLAVNARYGCLEPAPERPSSGTNLGYACAFRGPDIPPLAGPRYFVVAVLGGGVEE